MKMLKLLILAALVPALFACSTYKPREEGFGKMGYEEKKLDDGSYMLSYYGSSYDDEADVREKWNRRAAELCGDSLYNAETKSKEWTYDGYVILPPLFFKTKGASPLLEGKLKCKSKDVKAQQDKVSNSFYE